MPPARVAVVKSSSIAIGVNFDFRTEMLSEMKKRFHGSSGKQLLLATLANQSIVHGNDEIASQLCDSAKLQELKQGEVLISQDGEENDISFIVSGSLNVEVNGRLIAVRQSGTHVGEMAVLDGKARRCATVKAAELSVVATVRHAKFVTIADKHPELWRRIAVELCDRLRARNRSIRRPNEVPNIFICSSSENVAVAKAIQNGLKPFQCTVRVWTDGVFRPMQYTLEDLEREVLESDFAIAVVADDDVVRSRKSQSVAPRDNVVFELGLFMGQLGRKRTFMVMPRAKKLKLPSDLFGLNPIKYDPPSDMKNKRQLALALSTTLVALKTEIERQGCR